jgi:hypothetical protein
LPVSNSIELPPISSETWLTSTVIRVLSAASGWRHGFLHSSSCEPGQG